MEHFMGSLCLASFLGVVFALGYVLIMIVASPDYRILWRTIRRGRFGLKTAFGILAVSALSLGLLSAFRVDWRAPDFICMLAITVPLALFFVTFAGLSLSEMFDNRSTRSIVARRAEEDELSVFARDRNRPAKEESGADPTELEKPAEEDDPLT